MAHDKISTWQYSTNHYEPVASALSGQETQHLLTSHHVCNPKTKYRNVKLYETKL